MLFQVTKFQTMNGIDCIFAFNAYQIGCKKWYKLTFILSTT